MGASCLGTHKLPPLSSTAGGALIANLLCILIFPVLFFWLCRPAPLFLLEDNDENHAGAASAHAKNPSTLPPVPVFTGGDEDLAAGSACYNLSWRVEKSTWRTLAQVANLDADSSYHEAYEERGP